ncbi:hypothetical protein [Agromyces mediolanus]|uniref:hypothetical protein n=1 Tax=Agromyces mediolanus TaxID=41986 RepID=UPI001E4E3178|nr:hypothetical protein [Agromyces mediolanus]
MTAVHLIVDVANVMGSRPDGWWRDRRGAATRLLAGLPALLGAEVEGPDAGGSEPLLRLDAITAVVEGAARGAAEPGGILVVAAPTDGDSTIVELVAAEASIRPLVVTADRGLRARLDPAALVAGPGWLNRLLGR